jgi:hypothetical protein
MEIAGKIFKFFGWLIVACFGLVMYVMFGFLFGTLKGKR